MIIKNISGSELTLVGLVFANNDTYEIPKNELDLWQADESVLALILSEDVSVDDVVGQAGVEILTNDFPYSLAVDKGPNAGTDQSISGTDWAVVTHEQVLWDFHSDYDTVEDDFVIPLDGVYHADFQVKVGNFSGTVTAVELALFKRETPADDYWFIIDKKEILSGMTEIQLSASTLFNFYKDERYCLKIKLYGTTPGADVIGDDDFTSWGFNFLRRII